jgi:hypothetical protein
VTTAADLNPNLEALITEALGLRSGLSLPSINQGPVEVLERLIDVRTRLDRVEELLSRAVRFRTAVRARLKEASGSLDEAWATKVAQPSARRRAASDGFGGSAPRERYAEADLATLDEKRNVRRLEQWFDQVSDAVEVIRQAHRGLDTTRQDLHLILRAISVESALER